VRILLLLAPLLQLQPPSSPLQLPQSWLLLLLLLCLCPISVNMCRSHTSTEMWLQTFSAATVDIQLLLVVLRRYPFTSNMYVSHVDLDDVAAGICGLLATPGASGR
jgi:hypothetical protein